MIMVLLKSIGVFQFILAVILTFAGIVFLKKTHAKAHSYIGYIASAITLVISVALLLLVNEIFEKLTYIAGAICLFVSCIASKPIISQKKYPAGAIYTSAFLCSIIPVLIFIFFLNIAYDPQASIAVIFLSFWGAPTSFALSFLSCFTFFEFTKKTKYNLKNNLFIKSLLICLVINTLFFLLIVLGYNCTTCIS